MELAVIKWNSHICFFLKLSNEALIIRKCSESSNSNWTVTNVTYRVAKRINRQNVKHWETQLDTYYVISEASLSRQPLALLWTTQ